MEFNFVENVKVFSSEVSDGPMSLFNGDLQKNSPEFLSKIGSVAPLAFCEQHHGTQINIVKDTGSAGKCDGIISKNDLTLAVRTADCVPVMVSDNEFIGAIHCGRKSLVGGIIESLGKLINGDSAKIFLGPHIRVNNYEIKSKLVDDLKDTKWKRFIINKNGKFYFDMTKAVSFALDEIGIKEENIFDCGIDTFVDTRFFSARRDSQENVKTFITVIFKNGKN